MTNINTATVLENLNKAFNPSAAINFSACYQFFIAGDEDFFFIIDEQTIQSSRGEHDDPDISLQLSLATFNDILQGNLGGTQAFMTGKIKAQGNIMLAKELSKLFSKPT